MGSERIGFGDVSVVFLLRGIAERHGRRLGPCLKIGRGGFGDGAESGVTFARIDAEVEHVALFGFRPEGDVLRIENAVAINSFFLNLSPMDAVG